MPKPRALGNVASAIVSSTIERVAENQSQLFHAVILIYSGDKEAAVQALKPIADNETVVLQVLTLLRAGEISAAEEILIDFKTKRHINP